MKKYLFSVFIVCAALALSAQSTQKSISYQSVLRNAENHLLHDTTVNVSITIFSGSSEAYSERHTVRSNANGIISLLIGDGDNKTGEWDDIDWEKASVKVVSEVNGVTLATQELPFSAVPLAFQALESDTAEYAEHAEHSEYADSADIGIVKRFVDAQEFLTEEKQRLTLSNDTIYLTGGSFVELPEQNNVPANVAIQDADNTFTGINDFTVGTTNVASAGINLKTDTYDATNCTNTKAVNACDLLAVFDSLNRRMQAIESALEATQAELDALKNATPPTVSVTVDETKSNSIKVTAIADGHGAAVNSYVFCVYENGDLNNPVACSEETPDNTYTFTTGILGNKDYFVTVKAKNLAGSTTSDAVAAHTPAHAPTITDVSLSPAPMGFKVNISDIDPKEADAVTVQVFYKAKEDAADCPISIDEYEHTEAQNATIPEHFESISGLTPLSQYCVIVVIGNGNADSNLVIGPKTATSGENLALNVSCTSGTVSLCGGSSASAVLTASFDDANVEDFDFTWSEGSTNVASGNPVTITFGSVGEKVVSCTATHKSEGYSVSGTGVVQVVNTGSAPSFTTCEEGNAVNVKFVSNVATINWGDGNTESNPTTSSFNYYNVPGIYTITAYSADGCVATKKIALGNSTLSPCSVSSIGANERGTDNKIDSLQDADDNWYGVVEIGTQCWMKSNLRTSKYSDGTPINNGTNTTGGPSNTVSTTVGYYYTPSGSFPHYTGDYGYSLVNSYDAKIHGYYYNWPAVMNGANSSSLNPSGVQGVCPRGWHVPSSAEWQELIDYLKEQDDHFSPLLAGGCSWKSAAASDNVRPGSYESPSRNASGFSAVAAGHAYKKFDDTRFARFWSATLSGNKSSQGIDRPYYHRITSGNSFTEIVKDYEVNYGFSVRCVRD